MFLVLTLVAFLLVMWFAIIRPQQRRQRDQATLQAALELGDEVMLTSGVYGVLDELAEEWVGLEVADGVSIRVARPAIARVVAPTADEEYADDAVEDDDPGLAGPTRDAVPEES